MKNVKEVQEFIKKSCDKYGYICYTKDTEGMGASFKSAVRNYENVDENSVLIVISYFKRALISGILTGPNGTVFNVTLRDNQMAKDLLFVVSMRNGKEEECFKTHFLEEMVNVGFLDSKQIREKKVIPTGYDMLHFSESTFNKMLNDIMQKRGLMPFDSDYVNHNANISMVDFVDSEEGLSVEYDVNTKNEESINVEIKTSTVIGLVESLEETVADLDKNGYLKTPNVPKCVLDTTYNILGETDFNKVISEIQKLYESNK